MFDSFSSRFEIKFEMDSCLLFVLSVLGVIVCVVFVMLWVSVVCCCIVYCIC